MKQKTLFAAILILILPLIAAAVVMPGRVDAARASAGQHTLSSKAFTAGAFSGKFVIRHFVARNGRLMAIGTFTGTVKKDNTTHAVNQAAIVPVQSAAGQASTSMSTRQPSSTLGSLSQQAGSCTVLHLVLGPINLNLLGLNVTTNQIVVDISGQQGPGNLLGNLVCGVANLLNGLNLSNVLQGAQTTLLRDAALILNDILRLGQAV